jgi:hypothetical protein
MEGEIHGSYFKSVMGAMLSSEFIFPELSKKVSNLNEREWYPLQTFSTMLYEVAEKMPAIVMTKIGKNIIFAAQDTLLKFGFNTIEKIARSIAITLTGIVRKVELSKVMKTITSSSNGAIFAYSKIMPVAYGEGLIRGTAQVYKKVITKLEIEEDDSYYIYIVEWS